MMKVQPTVKFILMRHGESQNDVLGIPSSSCRDIYHLTHLGREQVINSAQSLSKEEKIDLIISSPLARAKETAKIVAEYVSVLTAIRTDYRLIEPHFGEMEEKSDQDYYSLLNKNSLDLMIQGIETESSVSQRINHLMHETLCSSEYRGKTVLLITHDFIICQMAKYFGKGLSELPKHAQYFSFEIDSMHKPYKISAARAASSERSKCDDR
jgi:broad specificity phosphatase PhoE